MFGLITTSTTNLGSETGVNSDYSLTCFLSFIAEKRTELAKTPTVQTTARVPFAQFDAASNLFEVLNYDGSASRYGLNNSARQNVVTIPMKPLLSASQFFQMEFSRLCAFGLQLPSDTKIAAVNFRPMGITQELTGGSYGGAHKAQIYPDYLLIIGIEGIGQGHNHIQPVATTTIERIVLSIRI